MSDSNILNECFKISEYNKDIVNMNKTGSIRVIFLHIYGMKTMLNFKKIYVLNKLFQIVVTDVFALRHEQYCIEHNYYLFFIAQLMNFKG